MSMVLTPPKKRKERKREKMSVSTMWRYSNPYAPLVGMDHAIHQLHFLVGVYQGRDANR